MQLCDSLQPVPPCKVIITEPFCACFSELCHDTKHGVGIVADVLLVSAGVTKKH